MKRFFLAIMAIVIVMWLAPLAQAVTVNGERQVGASSNQPTSAAYQQPVNLEARIANLEKENKILKIKIGNKKSGLTKRMKEAENGIAENKTAVNAVNEDLSVVKNKVAGHERWLKAIAESYNKTAATVSGLLKDVKKVREEVKEVRSMAIASAIISVFAGIIAAVCFIFGVIFLVCKLDKRIICGVRKEQIRNFKEGKIS